MALGDLIAVGSSGNVGGICSPTFPRFGTGTDGAFNPTSDTTLTSSVYLYSSINIPAGVTVTATDSFLVLLCTGTVTINGTIDLSGAGGTGNPSRTTIATNGQNGQNGFGPAGAGGGGGAGGFGSSNIGGAGGSTDFSGGAGSPVGASSSGQSAPSGGSVVGIGRVGMDFRDMLLIKGAGGGTAGGATNGTTTGTVGAAGSGGGLVIIEAPSIVGSGVIKANGTDGGTPVQTSGQVYAGGGGGGGGGAIFLFSDNPITVPTVQANGGTGGAGLGNWGGTTGYSTKGGNGGNGLVLKVVS
jgi:hypothetical protein